MKQLIGVIILLLLSFSINAQNREANEIYFEKGSSTIDTEYVINGDILIRLASKLTRFTQDSTITINKIKIDSYASPEGGLELNDKLSLRRAEAVYDYINSLELNIPDSLISISSNGIAWDELRKIVSESDMSYRDEVVDIIDNVPEETWAKRPTSSFLQLVDSRIKHLKDLKYGDPYRYMMDNIFPLLRKSSIVTIYLKKDIPPVIEVPEPTAELTSQPTTIPAQTTEEQSKPTIKPLLALKTNLLYDAVTALNLEIEIPIKEHWSVSAEWIFPWWTSCGKSSNAWQKYSKRNSLQLLQGNIEGKYWFGERTNRPVMTGWFVGLGGGLGIYDLERKADGYQGKFYTIGLNGGYAHTIFKKKLPDGNLRMEYSLGLGYMQTNYDKYNEHLGADGKWHTLRTESGKQSWLGPTKAKVSLAWLFNRNINNER